MRLRICEDDFDNRSDCHCDCWIQALAAGIGATNSFLSGLMGMRNTDKTNSANKQMVEDTNQANLEAVNATNATNKAIADQNLGFQQQSLDYQKALNQQIMEREDTAYQRTVEDMRAAGLSPLSMQNTNGSGGVVSAPEAMHNDFQAQTPQFQAGHVDSNAANINAAAQLMSQAVSDYFQTDLLRAQAKKTSAEADAQVIQNRYADALAAAQLGEVNLRNWHGREDFFEKVRSNDYKRGLGFVDGMSDDERRALILLRSLGVDLSDNVGRGFSEHNGAYTETGKSSFTPNKLTTLSNAVNGMAVASGLKDLVGDLGGNFISGMFSRKSGKGKRDKFDFSDEQYQRFLDNYLPF